MAKSPLGPEVPRTGPSDVVPNGAEALQNLKLSASKTVEQYNQDRGTVMAAREPVVNVTEDQLRLAASQIHKSNPAVAKAAPEYYMAA